MREGGGVGEGGDYCSITAYTPCCHWVLVILQYHTTYHSSVCYGGNTEGGGGDSNFSRRLLHMIVAGTNCSQLGSKLEREYQLSIARGPNYHDVIMKGCVCVPETITM